MSIEVRANDREARYAAHRRMQWKVAIGVATTGIVLGTTFGTVYHYTRPLAARCYYAISDYLSR